MARPPKPEFAIIGLGRFGTSLAVKLVQMGYSVLGIDRNRDLVQQLSDDLTQVVALDATDEDALRSVGIDEFQTVVVAIGDNFEGSILVTALLKEIGVQTVICKALHERHRAILRRVGASEVILPEHEAGLRLARHLALPLFIDELEMEPGLEIIAVRCPDPLAGHSLGELDLPGRFGVTVLLIKGRALNPKPRSGDILEKGAILLVIGPDEGLARMQTWQP